MTPPRKRASLNTSIRRCIRLSPPYSPSPSKPRMHLHHTVLPPLLQSSSRHVLDVSVVPFRRWRVHVAKTSAVARDRTVAALRRLFYLEGSSLLMAFVRSRTVSPLVSLITPPRCSSGPQADRTCGFLLVIPCLVIHWLRGTGV